MRTIKSKREFSRTFSTGVRSNAKLVRLVVAASPHEEGCVAFVAPKRLGKAVFRNRCKRVLRACAQEAGLPRASLNVILLATAHTALAPHDAVVQEVSLALHRAQKRLAAKGNIRSDDVTHARTFHQGTA